MDKKKEIVDLSPQNSKYAEQISQARSVQHPVGGAPMPKMPNFAEAQKRVDRFDGVQGGDQRRQGMAALLSPEQRAALEARGKSLPGVGSAYVANQPSAREVLPQQEGGYQNPPRPEGAGLSAATAEQLEVVAKANSQEAAEPSADQMKKDLDEFAEDLFDYDEFGNKVKNILANKERRKIVEARCEPMDLMQLLVDREVRQVVPIIPGRYYPTFRTMGGDEDLEVKRLIASEKSSTQYVLSKMTLMNLTCGMHALNGKVLLSHLDKNGDFDQEAFAAKYKSILKYPMQVLADLAVNYTWFDRRVRELIAFEPIKDF